MHQVQLARAVADARRMTPEVLRLFTEDGPDEVVLPECSQLAPAALAEALVPCATPRYAHTTPIHHLSGFCGGQSRKCFACACSL